MPVFSQSADEPVSLSVFGPFVEEHRRSSIEKFRELAVAFPADNGVCHVQDATIMVTLKNLRSLSDAVRYAFLFSLTAQKWC